MLAHQGQQLQWLNACVFQFEGGSQGNVAADRLIDGPVIVAGLIWDALLQGVLINRSVPAPFAGARISAIDDVLHAQVCARPLALFNEDVCPVC